MTKKFEEVLSDSKKHLEESIKLSMQAKMEELVEAKKKAKYEQEEEDKEDDTEEPEEDDEVEDSEEEDDDSVNESVKLVGKESSGSNEARIYWNSDDREFTVKLYKNGVYQKGADYFSDDKSDAYGTAKQMVK